MHKLISSFLGTLSIIGLMAMPIAVSAQTTDINALIAQTQALIAQINALQAQQANRSTGTATPTQTAKPGSSASGACPLLSRALSFGAKGSDVSSLQQFLAQDATIYPEQQVTGYFGALTQAAVQRWQAAHSIVSSGTSSTTGYGSVGPHTRAAMMAGCPGGSARGGVASGYIQVSPATGNAPLTTTITATVNTTGSCAGTSYMIDFGDGPSTKQYISTAGNCNRQTQAYTHTYTSGGVYTVTLAAGGHQTSTTVTVNGPGAQTGGFDTIHPSVATGTAPLAVTFTGTVNATDAGSCTSTCTDMINFGDGGSVTVPLPAAQSGYQAYTTYIVTHTYAQPGAYITSLMSSASTTAAQQTFAVAQINVSGPPVAPPALTIRVNATAAQQGGNLPITWTSSNIATTTPSAVGLWMVNVLTGTLYPLAMTLNINGTLNAPIPATAADGTVPPPGAYVVLGKIYTPADAVLTGVPPVYWAIGRSDSFNVTNSNGSSGASGGSYSILSVTTGVGGSQSTVNMNISYPGCSSYSVDWGDGTPLQNGGGANAGCGAQNTLLLSHTYQNNGTAVVRLLNGSGIQQATVSLSISNAGTTSRYGMLSVTSNSNGNPLNVAVQLSVPSCPSFSLDWGDGSLAASQTAASGCRGTGVQSPTFYHSYASGGTYLLKLTDASSTLQSNASINLPGGSNGASGTNSAPAVSTVSIIGMAYSPSSITAHAGDTVTWTNNDTVTHTVSADDGSFGSSSLSPGDTYSYTFAQKGSFSYHCALHPGMFGTVTVQ